MKTTNLLIGLSTFALATHVQAKKDNPPNIIYIIMDDLGYGDIGCYGQEKIETPNIDLLYQNGMHFTQHYSGSPVSAPARCVLMTGMHSGHAQIRANDEMASRGSVSNCDSMYVHPYLEGQFPLKHNTMTLGRMMQSAGYKTGCFGKWGLGYPGSDGTPNKQGFDSFYGYNCQRQAHNYYPAFLYKNENRVYLDNPVIDPHSCKLTSDADPRDAGNYARFTQKEYANDLIFDELITFVDENRKTPFFLMWTTPLPHVSLQAPERWVEYYVKKFGDEKPYTGTAGYLPCRYPHATYAAMISYFDEQIGKLVEKLKAEGIYDNTLIMFTSDNGPTFNGGSDSPWFNSGGPFKSKYGWGKNFVHEGGIRVPAIVCWPGKIKPGTATDHISGFQDMMPTLAEIAKIPCPPTDGISFLPTLLGERKKQKQHEYLYWEYPDPIVGSKAIRMGKWKGIIDNIRKGNDKMKLYDLETDLKEEKDIAQQHPDIVIKLKNLMEQAHTEPQNPKFRF
ncbi:arylsulfatase [Bacteroides acidifaciens]|uniref:arylsulfatase n=1 Tax=Bacteroides acidifaciens TaxID=85831 RepID=UPI003014FC20